MKQAVFRAELLDGHKGPAVIVPFDPEVAWGVRPTAVVSETYGERPGHLIAGTLNGQRFEGWIGQRWGRFFILVDEALQCAARIEVGDVVEVAIAPRSSGAEPARSRSAKPAPRRVRRTSSKTARSRKKR